MLSKSVTLPFSKTFEKIPPLVFTILFWSIVGFIFLGCANFFGLQGVFILVAMALMAIYTFLKSKVIVSWPLILSSVFALAYSVSIFVYDRSSVFSALLYSVIFPVLILFFDANENKRKVLIWVGGAYIGGLLLSFALISLSTYWHQGLSFNGDVMNAFWTHTLVARTGISLYEISAIGAGLAILMFSNRFRRWYTIPLIILSLLACFYISIMVGNRSFIVALFVLVYAILVFKILQPGKATFWIICIAIYSILFVSFFLLYFLYHQGLITIPDALMRIRLINRLFSENIFKGRPELLKEFFSSFYLYPFGGLYNHMSLKYTHNLLLDFYTFGGVIPFVIAALTFVYLIIYFIRFTKIPSHSTFEKALITCVTFAILGLGLIEPIYQANPNCLMPLFLIFIYVRHFAINEYVPVKKEEKRERKFKLFHKKAETQE